MVLSLRGIWAVTNLAVASVRIVFNAELRGNKRRVKTPFISSEEADSV